MTRPRRKLWTRDEVRFLQNSGLLDDGQYELVEGELLQKMPKNEPHVFSTVLTRSWAESVFGGLFVRSQDPIALDQYSEPEPDVVVLSKSMREYLTLGTPPADDVRLLIEVSDSTLEYDLTRKAALYARTGVAEYWVLDLPNRRLHVHLDPLEAGYGRILTLAESQTIAPLANSDAAVLVSTLLP
jgi:Uma2 family endonuclease